MITLEDVTIGFDPEFMLKDIVTGKYVSGLNFDFGEKGRGKEVCPNCTVENDMVTLEMVLPPVKLLQGLDEMWENYSTVKNLVEADLPDEIKLDCCSQVEFDSEQLIDERANIGGCSTDFNAWENGLPNDTPNFDANWRCSGK